MELFELFGKIVIGGADEANRKIDSVADNAERKAVKICNAFEKIGSLNLNFGENVKLPNISTENEKVERDNFNDGISALIDSVKNAASAVQVKQPQITKKLYSEKIHHVNTQENINVEKNITQFDFGDVDNAIKKIGSVSEKIKSNLSSFIDAVDSENLSKQYKSDIYNKPMVEDVRYTVSEKAEKITENISRDIREIEIKQAEIPEVKGFADYIEGVKKVADKITEEIGRITAFEKEQLKSSDKQRGSFVNGICESTEKAMTDVVKECEDAFDKIHKKIGTEFNKANGIIVRAMADIVRGVINSGASVADACGWVSENATKRLHIDGTAAGNYAMETFKGGILQKASDVYNSVSAIAYNISALMASISVADISANVSLSMGSMPKYAKGGIVTREHIARVGEDGAEAIIPLERNTEWIDKVASRMSGNVSNSEVVSRLDELISLVKSQGIYLDSGQLVGALAGKMDRKLGSMARLKKRGV